MTRRRIFITGGTGYIGRRLIPALIQRGHGVRVLVRHGSESKVPSGSKQIPGDPLDRVTFTEQVAPSECFVHLVGVSHPGPGKAGLYRTIDLVSVRECVAAAKEASIQHFVYVSVAQPAPIMKEYIRVRSEAEQIIRSSGLNATILRPWYVLGPGHRWPYLLLPVYWLSGLIPSARASAQRLALVTIDQMVAALLNAVENPPRGIRTVEVPQIRFFSK